MAHPGPPQATVTVSIRWEGETRHYNHYPTPFIKKQVILSHTQCIPHLAFDDPVGSIEWQRWTAGDQNQSIVLVTPRPFVDPVSTGNRTPKTTWSVLGPPYCRLLQSAGATEDLFATRGLHQQPPPHSLKDPFHEPTNHTDEWKKQTTNVRPPKEIDWHDQFNWLADQCCLSFHWTVVADMLVADQLNFFKLFDTILWSPEQHPLPCVQIGGQFHHILSARGVDSQATLK